MPNSIVAPVQDSDAAPDAALLLDMIRRKYGMVPNLYRTMAHAPKLLQALMELNGAVEHDLPPRLRLLAYLRASVINGCSYCTHYYRRLGRAAGLTDAELAATENEADLSPLGDVERAVVEFSSQLTRTSQADDGIVQRLRQSLTDSQYVLLVATVGLANLTNRFNHACGVELP